MRVGLFGGSPLSPPPYMFRTTSWKRWQIPCFCCGWDKRRGRASISSHSCRMEQMQAGPEVAEQSSLLKVGRQEVFRTAGFYTVSFIASPYYDMSYRDIAAVYSADLSSSYLSRFTKAKQGWDT
ncbi:uncharacterized protein LOC110430793 [Sorghum bicolor]|uniref:uncharacterized protein LOC110430793 n=1 Tax=Sorghum bicolor TaxID=4558 RepID=UPI00081AC1F5|nr:uncharacterized protein LOC110430793 [Sorghum bicolor]|eukprot:XP_021304456.1 uncharacterized protein LOC110430793 [Sorghum bicolor]